MELTGKRVLITGGAKRIGRGIGLAFAAAGADVAFTYLRSADEAHATARDLTAYGGEVLALRCDVRDPLSVREAAAEVIATFDGLDVLVNNAGVFASASLDTLDPQAWDDMFATNTRGPLLIAQACLGALRISRGRIVNIGSLGGLRPWPTHGHYCASKAALHMLTLTMAKAWAPEVSVNAVAPGLIEQGEVEPEYTHMAEKTPMQRNGSVTDVSDAVMAFATGSAFVTGQILSVDGGLGL